MASSWQCECGVSGVEATDPQAMKAFNAHADVCAYKTDKRSLHRELVAAKRERDIAVSRAESLAMGASPNAMSAPPKLLVQLRALRSENELLKTQIESLEDAARESADLAGYLIPAPPMGWADCARQGCDAKHCTWGSAAFCYPHEEALVGKTEMDRRYALSHDENYDEDGPGIAPMPDRKPDNSIAFLDEDLLCDDA